MTLSVAIAINVVAMVALVSLLSHVMSRAAQLMPHGGRDAVPAFVPVATRPGAPARSARRRAALASLGS
jgi:hypothetical protein